MTSLSGRPASGARHSAAQAHLRKAASVQAQGERRIHLSHSTTPGTRRPARPGRQTAYRRLFDAFGDGIIVSDRVTGRIVAANPAAASIHGYDHAAFLGLAPARYIHPDSLPAFQESLENLPAGAVFESAERHLRQDGSPFPVEVHSRVFVHLGRSCLLSVVRDISQRVASEELLRQQVAAREREQATLLQVSHTLASALDFQPGTLLDQLHALIDYSHAALFARDGTALVALVVRGPSRLARALPTGTRIELSKALEALLKSQQPVRVRDADSGEADAQMVQAAFQGAAESLLQGARAFMWVPLSAKGRVLGGIVAAHSGTAIFTEHQAALAFAVANQAAITLVNRELHRQAQELAVLEERQRLAHDLHDAVNQSLFSAGLIAEVLPRLWEQDASEGRRSLEDLRRLTRGAAAEMRGLLAALRPSVIADADLEDLLRQLGDALMGRSAVTVTVRVTGRGSLPAAVQMMFYQLCQEALNNIAKHARAQQVTILLRYGSGEVLMRIQDDGQGFVVEDVPAGHIGLSMMREQAAAAGAALSVRSRAGKGTEITVRWPDTEPRRDK